MTDMQSLDPFTLPLSGRRLIEASAGTGKTWTLAALYVRLVIGQGNTAFPEGLDPDRILVLTYTRAATRELRQRIRERLAQAAVLFSNSANNEKIIAIDPFMEQLLTATAGHHERCGQRCREASQKMDQATIHTLHGFCQRSLTRFAFAAGHAFDLKLETDTYSLADQAYGDYWRRFIQPLSPALIRFFLKAGFTSPQILKSTIKKEKIRAADAPQQTPFPEAITTLEDHWNQLEQARQATRDVLQKELPLLGDWFLEQLDNKNLSGTSHKRRHLDALTHFVETGDLDNKTYGALERFTPSGMTWNTGKEGPLPDLASFKQIDSLLAREGACQFPTGILLQHVVDWVAVEQEKQLAARAQITYDTMVTHLSHALEGKRGNALAEQLFEAYPCTLIDEFQDTDKNQYAIFNRVYQQRSDENHAWLMIGDPKQAIYAFRGADINTYIRASQATPNQYTLSTNFRSASAMVAACNHLFDSSPLRTVENGLFGNEIIQFHPVAANGRDDQLLIDGKSATALTFCYPDDEPHGKDDSRSLLAAHFARRVARLLAQSQEGCTGFQHAGGQVTPLKPSDICLLVRDGNEADALKQALADHDIGSVFLSERSSVYNSPAATDLFCLMSAIAAPHDGGLVRAALACDLLAFEPAQLTRMMESDESWQTQLICFRQLHDTWQTRGVLPMVHRLVHLLKVPERQHDPRQLTDLFHLAELLQQASVTLDGIDALLHFLEATIASDTKGDDDNRELLLRLESERDQVTIMTLHKSKGLEYPLVMLPFACLAHGSGWETEADDEMRLLYVGITRAIHACWLGLLPCKHGRTKQHQLETSSLGRLLFGNEHVETTTIHEQLQTLCQSSGNNIRLDATPTEDIDAPDTIEEQDLPPLLKQLPLLPVRTPSGWGVTSYSRLLRQLDQDTFSSTNFSVTHYLDTRSSNSRFSDTHFAVNSERLLEESFAQTQPGNADTMPLNSVHAFTRGAEAGNFLHGLLETLCRQGFGNLQPDDIKALVQRRCHQPQWQNDKPLLTGWLTDLLFTPLQLGSATCALAQVQSALPETEFWLGLKGASTQALDALTEKFLPGERQPLNRQQLNGMLKGFIDLLFCVDGRYYVLDYKSNWLGPDDAAYTQDNMQRSMLEHRYDLQSLIYQLALHRLLRARLPNYDPTTQLGGSLYFFLRGIGSPQQGLFLQPAQPSLLNEMDQLFLGSTP